jgi:hypothetical protein
VARVCLSKKADERLPVGFGVRLAKLEGSNRHD